MENFASILERDYGFKSGKNAPMVSGSAGGSSGGGGYAGLRKSVPSTRMSANAGAYGQEDPFGVGRKNEGSKSGRSSYGSRDDLFSPAAYHDVFGGPPKSSDAGARYGDVYGGGPQGAPVFDELLGGFGGSSPKVKSASGSFHSSPRRSDRNHFVSSEPVYDELLPGFGFLPKSRASSEAKVSHEPDPFVPVTNDPLASSSAAGSSAATFDDDDDDDDGSLLPGFEGAKSRTFSGDAKSSRQPDPLLPMFDDPLPSSIPLASSSYTDEELLPGFSSEGPKSRSFREATVAPVQESFGSLGDEPISSSIPSGSPEYDDLLNVFNEPQVPPSSSSSRAPGNGVKADRFESFDSFPHSPGNSGFFKDSSRKSADDGSRTTSRVGPGSPEAAASAREGIPSDDIPEVSPDSDPFFPSQTESGKSAGGLGSSGQLEEETPAWDFPTSGDLQIDRGSSGNSRSKDLKNAWLTIDDMKLLTQPSPVPPPSRRPPPLPGSGSGFREKAEARDAEFVTSSSVSTPEEDGTGSNAAAPPSYEQVVPGWMDFKMQPSRDEEKEREEREKREEARKERRRQEREEAKAAREIREREIREREAKQAREQERLRRDKEREKDRAAVRIATLEARERAAQEAREKAERSAVERVTGEARERAASQARARVERAAVERANAEARERAEVRAAVERAAAEARERAERASAEKAAVERAAGEVRERASRAASEKAAVERAQSEARERAARVAAEKAAVERAAAEARERAERAAAEKAAAARERSHQQRKSENDLESFFANSGPPASNDARQRPSSMNNNTNVFGETRRTSSATATTTGSMDDWASIFGATPSSDDSQDSRRGGETGGRTTRARTERQQHTRERAAKAIAEINQRDLETQREQAEKQRAGDVLDAEIRRWAAGKEGNLRALLSTLQYVLWPECGWTPVSLTDLINPTSVKKTYRKATLYVHPDKVQQKGATVQQKYIAEKVFDLLKEASNKFNSEELF